jgi:hypothetical protein
MAGDDITTDRPVAKYLWLMYVRERTKWISCNVRDVDGSSAPFVITLNSSFNNRMTPNISSCKNATLFQLLGNEHFTLSCLIFSFNRNRD